MSPGGFPEGSLAFPAFGLLYLTYLVTSRLERVKRLVRTLSNIVNALIASILPRRDPDQRSPQLLLPPRSSWVVHLHSPSSTQSCPRLLRADDGPKKTRVSNANSIAGSIASVHAEFMPSAFASARPKREVSGTSLLLPVAFGLIIGSIPLVIIAVLWHSSSESSSLTERVIMLL